MLLGQSKLPGHHHRDLLVFGATLLEHSALTSPHTALTGVGSPGYTETYFEYRIWQADCVG